MLHRPLLSILSRFSECYSISRNLLIDINNYVLDLNSRTITKDKESLKLTQKEIDIILFLNDYKKPQKVNILQNKVWGYSLELETHTVETHIYRLRKKIKEAFNDENLITSEKNGYLIK